MKCFVNRFHKAFQLAASVALTVALALPLTALSAQPQKNKKPATTQLGDKKKPSAIKTAAQKKPSNPETVAAKAPLKAKASPKQRSEKPRKKALVASPSRNSISGAKVAARQSGPAASVVRVAAQSRLSAGDRLGLRDSDDPLDLSASVALVVDQDTNEVLFSKNESAVLPIASLTKLMTGLVIADANLSMDEEITITQDDVDVHKGSRSRLAVGTMLTRGELMHLALMSSENRAAHALGRTYPGGLRHFVSLMNSKARELGMQDTRYVEPTGLFSQNQSSARDLATLVSEAYERPILRSLSTSPGYQLELGRRMLRFNNSNRLIHNPQWEIGLQKTGYISEAGRCLVMQTKVAGRKVIMVFLDAAGKLSRSEDAERVRRWVEAQTPRQIFTPPQG